MTVFKHSFSVVLLLFTFAFCGYAQEYELKSYQVHLVQNNNDSAVCYATIKNQETDEVFESDAKGIIHISGIVGDTLIFNCIGYESQTWLIPGIWSKMEEAISLRVEPKVYAIGQVDVVRKYTYAQFVHAFRRGFKIEETEQDKVNSQISSWGTEIENAIALGIAEGNYSRQTGFGIYSSAGRPDKITLQRKEVERLRDVADKSTALNRFISRTNIQSLTGYKDTCLDSFMVFFNVHYPVDYTMKPYELLSVVTDAYKDFNELYADRDWYVCDTLLVE